MSTISRITSYFSCACGGSLKNNAPPTSRIRRLANIAFSSATFAAMGAMGGAFLTACIPPYWKALAPLVVTPAISCALYGIYSGCSYGPITEDGFMKSGDICLMPTVLIISTVSSPPFTVCVLGLNQLGTHWDDVLLLGCISYGSICTGIVLLGVGLGLRCAIKQCQQAWQKNRQNLQIVVHPPGLVQMTVIRVQPVPQ